MAEGLAFCVVVQGSLRGLSGGQLTMGFAGGAHLRGWPVKAAPVQRAGAVHVDLVHILQALPVHGDHLISCGGQMVRCVPFTPPVPTPTAPPYSLPPEF